MLSFFFDFAQRIDQLYSEEPQQSSLIRAFDARPNQRFTLAAGSAEERLPHDHYCNTTSDIQLNISLC